MRILITTDLYTTETNGVVTSVRNLSNELIKKGQLVQIFPEGRNTPDGKIHEFKQSYIVIAHRANAPIIPIVAPPRSTITEG